MHASSHALLRLIALAFFALFAQARFPSSNIDLAVKRIEARLPGVQVPPTNSMPAQAESAPFLDTRERRLQDVAEVVTYASYLWIFASATPGATCTAACSTSGYICSDAVQSAGADQIDEETTMNEILGQFTSPPFSPLPTEINDIQGTGEDDDDNDTTALVPATPFTVGEGSTFSGGIYSSIKSVSTCDAGLSPPPGPNPLYRLCACASTASGTVRVRC
ncbi:hypothetical protein B484DRAFT_466419 [Ochromonadaceae sp. CCMP2298]|nr:hypothetical protein B484DRAFT_466419 [Ochromonadaceae sp. CCMP2298]